MGKVLSVYFTNEEIRICELVKKGSNVVLNRAFDEPLPGGVMDDGMIMDVEAAAKALYTAFKNNEIKKGKISFVISSRKIANKEVVIPYLKNANKIDEIIKANIDEYFPMNNLEDYVYKHTVLDTVEGENGKQSSVLVMAVQKQMIEGYYQLADMLKMPVVTIDYYGNAIYQLLKRQLDQGTVLALQMDRNMTYVSIMREKAQLFKRPIPYGRESIVKAIEELKGVSEEEAREALTDSQKLNLLLTQEEYEELIHDFAASVARVVEFHINRNPGTVIEQVKLFGTGVDICGFTDVLTRELGIEVVPIKELNGIRVSKKNKFGLTYDKVADYLPNVSVLLQPLNLQVKEEKKAVGSDAVFYALMILAALSVAATSGFLIFTYEKQKDIKSALEEEVESLKLSEATYLDYVANQGNYDLIKAYYDSTVNNSEALYQLLLDLEEVMPKSVGINTFTLTNGEITMTCIAGGKEPIASFVIELKKIPYVSNVRVKNITDVYDEFDQVTSTFNLSFSIRVMDEEETEGGTEE